MEKWILVISMIINLQDDKEWEQQREVIEPAFNQLMQFKMEMPTMEECWETAANIEGATLVLRLEVIISGRSEELENTR